MRSRCSLCSLWSLCFVLVVGLAACATPQRTVLSAAAERAAFDLDCPVSDIATQQLGQTNVIGRSTSTPGLERSVVGASGCGQKAVYVVECVGVGRPTCNAILNADARAEPQP